MPRKQLERVNSDKPDLWKADIAASVDQFNQWFMQFAPKAFRSTRIKTTEYIKAALVATDDLRELTPDRLRASPGALPTLRMCTAPPLAVDRLIGLSSANKSLVGRMERGKLAVRMKEEVLTKNLRSVCGVLNKLLDRDIFPWLASGQPPTEHERDQASTVVADRIVRTSREADLREFRRTFQIALVTQYLRSRGFRELRSSSSRQCGTAVSGTFQVGVAVPLVLGKYDSLDADLIIQPRRDTRGGPPVILDLRSSPNDLCKPGRLDRSVRKARELRMNYDSHIEYVLLLDGSVSAGFLGTHAAEGVDWVWQHRLEDLDRVLGQSSAIRT